ncbi:hypothetical protein BDN70DRAFT_910831 [Pholiota conissans]|uniref:Zinc finger Mcm10/DnaG-type domain-containing protein n=1 Tax=Pholiota conissans TaxID=109636 RepID=A0A9P5ZDY6_9AGAR|nr:hypothetical protein BDN70DRAFT_910831 [Pholiota conissans]
MNSSTSRTNAQKLTQEQIKRQIAELQARLVSEPEQDAYVTTPAPKSPKRKAPEPVVLAPATPSPKKKRKLDHQPTGKPPARPVFQTATQLMLAGSSKPAPKPETEIIKKIAPSNMLNKLASFQRAADLDDAAELPSRSTGFKEKPQEIRQPVEEKLAQKRDERLALIENLEPGPYEHTPPQDDPTFARLEPHSGINLSSRKIPHEDFFDYLRGRYYLSPSRLYSAIRLLPDKQGYDVPVAGDWITIGVVAERGPIKFTRAPVKIEREEGDMVEKKKAWKGKAKVDQPEPRGKKFVNLKLIDFGARSEASTSSKAVIRGDAFLTLLLFEADSFELIDHGDGPKAEKVYRGGSRGAFEHLTEVKEGDVIALLNPKILKPFQRSADTPHPVNNILAVTPESASSIMVIGRCRDLGMCQVRKQDGKVCGSWCDKRVSDVCDYHVQSAVQRRRAARPEFSIGSGGMSNSSTYKRKHDYDPKKQWGLKPEERTAGSNATYMVSGHIVSGSSADPRTLYVSEGIGREGQAKAKRILAGKDADKTLARLLERDKDGMKAVMKAREVGIGDGAGKVKGEKAKKKKNSKETSEEDEDSEKESSRAKENVVCKTAYSAAVIKSLGFDPTLKPGQRRLENTGSMNKLEALEAIRAARKDPELGPKPGPRIRSGVMAPREKGPKPLVSRSTTADDPLMYDLDESGDDEFPEHLTSSNVMTAELPTEEEQMVDLDDF